MNFLRGKNMNRVFCGVNFVVAASLGSHPQSSNSKTQVRNLYST